MCVLICTSCASHYQIPIPSLVTHVLFVVLIAQLHPWIGMTSFSLHPSSTSTELSTSCFVLYIKIMIHDSQPVFWCQHVYGILCQIVDKISVSKASTLKGVLPNILPIELMYMNPMEQDLSRWEICQPYGVSRIQNNFKIYLYLYMLSNLQWK